MVRGSLLVTISHRRASLLDNVAICRVMVTLNGLPNRVTLDSNEGQNGTVLKVKWVEVEAVSFT